MAPTPPRPQLPEVRGGPEATSALFARYLAYFRETAIGKVAALPAEEQRGSRLASGWSPLEMLSHLFHMERRWLVWGFLGEDVADPWGDGEDVWRVPPEVSVDDLAVRLREQGDRVAAVLAEHDLEQLAPPGPRFEGEPPTLSRICFHVLQEYARHVGHLDVAVELADGPVGE